MQEYSTPQAIEVADDEARVDAVTAHAENGPDDVVFTRRVDGRWAPVTA